VDQLMAAWVAKRDKADSEMRGGLGLEKDVVYMSGRSFWILGCRVLMVSCLVGCDGPARIEL
jgi:hypothetical protein